MIQNPTIPTRIPTTSLVRDVQTSLFPDLVGERAQGPLVPSVFRGSNADLIAAVAPLYLTGSVLDVTYGRGNWWHRFRPDPFTIHDLALDGVDFRQLPEPDASVDTATFDPPYISQGGTSDERKADYRDRYGLTQSCPNGLLWQVIGAGLCELARVVRPGGYLLVKCCDWVSGNGLLLGHIRVITLAAQVDLVCHDLIVHDTGSGPGGHNIVVPLRARRHHSYLVVLTSRRRVRRTS